MSIFDNKRLTNDTFKLDIERMRRGWYSDKYFENIGRMLAALASEKYTYAGNHHNLPAQVSPEDRKGRAQPYRQHRRAVAP